MSFMQLERHSMVSLKLPCIARGARVSREHSTTPACARRVQTKCVRKVSASETRSFVHEYRPPKTNYSFWTSSFLFKIFETRYRCLSSLLRFVLRTFLLTVQIHWLVWGFSVEVGQVYFVGLSVSKFERVALLNKCMIFGCMVYFLRNPDERL